MNSLEPIHFTYESFDKESDLYQGDILEPTEELRSIFREVHKHFLDEKYRAFLVLTQTCDLVRRNGEGCRSRYVNLAVVRPLEDVLLTFLDKICEKAQIKEIPISGIYLTETKNKAKQLLERIFNQNEQALGLFYLHPDTAVKIAEDSLALLQVSIALRSQEHYDAMVRARCGRLKAEFRDKLGWLIGNLFSRVATQDLPREKINDLTDRFLKPVDASFSAPRWISKQNVAEANKAGVEVEGLDPDKIVAVLKRHEPQPPKKIAIECAVKIVTEVIENMQPHQIESRSEGAHV